ncbi:hypothetical protein CBR_g37125 [Chara braunii]|uniref:Secreted protein n=1 Tax=Chara braunii TaxID=69332 RepID=A0A388LMC5_CHABU|nr:hypothetical protein CBR_g37125 [Chara braunii]|eukprot:GBG83411.1 hypothetical protein CBR_g37125 [Chara braunii]
MSSFLLLAFCMQPRFLWQNVCPVSLSLSTRRLGWAASVVLEREGGGGGGGGGGGEWQGREEDMVEGMEDQRDVNTSSCEEKS